MDPGGGSRRARHLARLAWPAGAVLALLLSLGQVGREHVGTDFHVFWEAGRDFAAGLPLYERAEGARRFIYPPFAAMVFQPLGLLSLDAAAVAFHALSLLLLAASAMATWRIADAWAPGRRRGALPLLLAILAVAHIAQSNLARNQTNLLVLALCLAGILASANRRPGRAAAWLSAATLIKLTPAVLLGWLAVRGGRRAPVAIALCLAAGLAAPVVLRGPRQGVRDHAEYVAEFLGPAAAGRVPVRPQNQALAAAVERALVPGATGDGRDWAWWPLGAGAARAVRLAATLAIAAAFVGSLLLLARRRRPPSLFEPAAAFLTAHLLSSVTWKAHLVTLLFVYYAVLSLPSERWPRTGRRALAGLAGVILASGLAGRSVTGARLQAALFGYSAYTGLLLLLLAACLVLALAPPARLGAPDPAGATGAGRS
ncbi:MAG TPA: glycosyltransferase family 87 protein [Gemmatimonadales bacterium]|nr:glycosyltransferase family 87 protein [Gemmatimonadales bacterium]